MNSKVTPSLCALWVENFKIKVCFLISNSNQSRQLQDYPVKYRGIHLIMMLVFGFFFNWIDECGDCLVITN